MTPSTSSQTKTTSVRHSFSNDNSPGSTFKRNSHSRSSSSVSAADAFSPTTASIPAVPSLPLTLPIVSPNAPTTAATATKKLYRQSAGTRLTQVKANIGLPRVRTSSITQKDQHQKPTTPPTRDISSSSVVLTHGNKATTPSSASNRQSNIPLPPSQQAALAAKLAAVVAAEKSTSTTTTTTSTTAAGAGTADITSPENGKKSLLKPPTQRGPGSTLRLRSMLAKRGGPLPPATALAQKPPMPSTKNNTDS